MKRGLHFTEPLPSNDRRDTHTDLWEGFMKYAVDMGSCAMIYTYIINCVKTASGIQKLTSGDSQAHRPDGDRVSLLSFFSK
jgi:hypothetical protein